MRRVRSLLVQPRLINEWALVAGVVQSNSFLIGFVSQQKRLGLVHVLIDWRGARPDWRWRLGVTKGKELIHYVPVLQVDS